MILGQLGITADEESVYRCVLHLGPVCEVELVKALTLPHDVVTAAVLHLRELGLLVAAAHGGEVMAAPPRVAVEPLIASRIRDLENVRAGLAELDREQRRPAMNLGRLVDVIATPEEAALRFRQIQLAAKVQVRAFDTPPYVLPVRPNPEEIDALARGVAYRIVYAGEALVGPVAMETLEIHVGAGEQARVVASLPLKVTIVDDLVALIAYPSEAPEEHTSLLVHPSPLLTGLIELFELHWLHATPVRLGATPQTDRATPGVDGEDLRLVTLLAAGLKDVVVARQLGMSPRTLQRRVHDLMIAFRVRTRLELLLIFARRGFLPDPLVDAQPAGEPPL